MTKCVLEANSAHPLAPDESLRELAGGVERVLVGFATGDTPVRPGVPRGRFTIEATAREVRSILGDVVFVGRDAMLDRADVFPRHCLDPTIADLDGDGADEVFVATTEQVIRAHDARTGQELFRRDLAGWGYAAPVITDFTPSEGRELLVADLSGGVFVFDSTGAPLWSRNFSSIIAPIFVEDFDADGTGELAIGEGKNVTVVAADGTIALQTSVGGSVTWMTAGQADDDRAIEIVAATVTGRVVVVDGQTGDVEWTQQYNTLAAVYAFGDGDGDGQAEVYAVAQDGKLRALDASDGTVEWTTTLTTEDVQMTPPPALGDLDGDDASELAAVSQDGVVSVINPKSGGIIDSYKRDVPIWMRPTLADLDDDGSLEILVVYGDGRVVALSFETK